MFHTYASELLGRRYILAAVLLVFSAVPAMAQITYSIDAQGPTNGLPSGGVGPEIIDEGDILIPTPPIGPLPPPTVIIPSSAGVGTLGIVPTVPLGFQELDALAYGDDDVIPQNPTFPMYYYFSADEFAVGRPGSPVPPNVLTQGAIGAMEASADVYVYPPAPGPVPPPPVGPIPFPGAVPGNTGVYDGNGGITPFASPTLNLVEPNPPTVGITPDPGDNLDALDIDTPSDGIGVFFSLDTAFADPFEALPYNTGTAFANGFVGGDVLFTPPPGGAPVLYAAAPAIGLDLVSGADSDDLDALILNDMTDGLPGVYTPTTGPYSWLVGTDMLLYSVRRGSALIGVPDSIFGAPIEPGDILVPMGPGTIPGIWISAEALGLATVRSGSPLFDGPIMVGDDLDALDVSQQLIPEPVLTTVLYGLIVLVGGMRSRRGRVTVYAASLRGGSPNQ
ncbi:MAG: hypothetical protein IT447_10995 [Phycisphaerales bacterium]|jgi:hypothetical protein|nr:hypothetical protein [Phycisphaerales bacterium]